MKHLVLAAAALLALGVGTAFADGNVTAQPAQTRHAAWATAQSGQGYTSTSRASVWVYPAFGAGDSTQGGEQ